MKGRDLGIDAARAAGAGVHADMLETFKGQLLIALLRRLHRLGQPLVIPAAEVDATGGFVLAMSVKDGAFHFELQRKA